LKGNKKNHVTWWERTYFKNYYWLTLQYKSGGMHMKKVWCCFLSLTRQRKNSRTEKGEELLKNLHTKP